MIISGVRNSAGEGSALYTPSPAEEKIKVGPFLQLQLKEAGTVNVIVKVGGKEMYDIVLDGIGSGVLFTDFPEYVSLPGESLTISLDVSKQVKYQIEVSDVLLY